MTALSDPLVLLPEQEPAIVQPAMRPRAGRAAGLLALAVLAVLLLVVPGVVDELDGQSMLQVTQSIVQRGDVSVPAPRTGTVYGVRGLHGQWYSRFGPAQSLLALPLYLAGRALAPLVPASYRPELPVLAASLLTPLLTAGTVLLLVLTAVELGASLGAALALATVYAFATPAIVYATQWFSEPLTACALLASVYLLLCERAAPTPWRPLLAGLALAVAVSTRLDSVVLVPPLALYALLPRERRVRRLVSLLLPLGVALGGLGLYNAARFGSPLETGYGRYNDFAAYRDAHPAHTLGSIAAGLYDLLLSPGKGLVEYAPPVLLTPFGAARLWVRRRAETTLLLSLFLIDLLAHANVLIRWVGGWSWGPRFVLPTLPFLLLLLAPLLDARARRIPHILHRRRGRLIRGALAVLVVAGVLVQAPALVIHEPWAYIYGQERLYCPYVSDCVDRIEQNYINEPARSPIVGSWAVLFDRRTWMPARQVSPALVPYKSIAVAPRTWWRLLALQGVPSLPLALVCALLLGAAIALWAAVLRIARKETGAARAARREASP